MKNKTRKRIGLCRHFPIPDVSSWKLMSSQKYREWIDFNKKILPEETFSTALNGWDICFSSDLPRAKKTAEVLASSIPVHYQNLLQEVAFHPFDLPLVLPKGAWLLISRLYWYFGGNAIETKKGSFLRAAAAADLLEKREENHILVITHGFFMHCLIKKLIPLGYKGSIPPYPEYGKVYLFEKNE